MRINARAKTVGKMLLTTFVATGVFACLTFLAAERANAQAPKADAPAGASDKVDVTDLEKKYWASKDTDFSVVQNRVYSKANRFALTAQYGFLINDQWSDGPKFAGSLGYYFS